MSAYSQPIFVAALVFSLLAFATFIPWLIYTYRKYGFLSFSKTMIAFSFIFYFLAALFLVLLPLPETTNTCALQKPGTEFYNLRPFQFVRDIFAYSGFQATSPRTWIVLVKQPAFYQAFFNFLLLLPFGVYLRYFFKKRSAWPKAFAIGLALTLFYEMTQVTGIYGIYNCPYRIFDVDDLMLNSLGSLFGFFLAPVILSMFPRHEDVVAQGAYLQQQDIVRPLHRAAAIAIDLALIQLFATFTTSYSSAAFFIETIGYAVVFLLVPLATYGATPGMWLVKIRYVDEASGEYSRKGIIKFFISLYSIYGWFAILRVLNAIELDMDSPFYVFQIILTLLTFTCALVSWLALCIHVVWTLFRQQRGRFFFERNGQLRATRKQAKVKDFHS